MIRKKVVRAPESGNVSEVYQGVEVQYLGGYGVRSEVSSSLDYNIYMCMSRLV